MFSKIKPNIPIYVTQHSYSVYIRYIYKRLGASLPKLVLFNNTSKELRIFYCLVLLGGCKSLWFCCFHILTSLVYFLGFRHILRHVLQTSGGRVRGSPGIGSGGMIGNDGTPIFMNRIGTVFLISMYLCG
jgi:hypothetical protein